MHTLCNGRFWKDCKVLRLGEYESQAKDCTIFGCAAHFVVVHWPSQVERVATHSLNVCQKCAPSLYRDS